MNDYYLWRGGMPEMENNISEDRLFAIWYISHFIGKWYKWGGDDPSGFDCSGLVIECLKAMGILPRKRDYTAHQLYQMFEPVDEKDIQLGCLVFWWNEDKTRIIHVEMVIDKERSIGASGGGGNTLTEADAIRQNAFIKIRPFKSRGNLAGFADPFIGAD